MIKFVLSVANKKGAGLNVSELNDGLPGHLLSKLLSVLVLRIEALDHPVVAGVALTVVAITRDLVLVRKWRWDRMGVQVLSSLSVFKSDDLSACDGLARLAELVLLGCLLFEVFGFFYRPEGSDLVATLMARHDLLSTTLTIADILREEIVLASHILEAHRRAACQS